MASVNANQTSDKDVMEPRRYQMELLNYVMQRNAIIYLPTGAGKTYIAIMALKRFSHQMQETIENGGKRAVFMCNTVELARQQAIELKRCTNLNVGFYIGERDVDNWSPRKWNDEIKINQVLVGTAQIFVDIISQNYIKITDLSVVIIDECHHARNNHPMHEFMRHYRMAADKSQLPRVIGLTGVLIKGNKLNKIREELENLEAIFHGKIVTVGSMEEYQNVMAYSTKPTEKLVAYTRQTHIFRLVQTIKDIINECAEMVNKWDLGAIKVKQSKNLGSLRQPNKKSFITNLLNDFVYQMEEFGLYAAAIAIMSPIIEFELKKRAAETMVLRNLYRYVISTCEKIRHIIIDELKEEITDPDDAYNTLDIIFNYSTPKMRSLLLLTKELFSNKDPAEIHCLIFVERRYTAKCVYYVLQHYINLEPILAKSLRPQFMVGRNSVVASIESLLYQKWNNTAIESFRNGDCNLLVCSNVLEEGIDVQACNYVFAYDPLKTFNSYVQTKGRARSSDALYAIFAQKSDEASVIQKIKGYQEAHKTIQDFLIGRILDQDEPKEQDIAEQFEDLITPFRTQSGAYLLASNALPLLYRYCALLPTDAFGVATPWFNKQTTDDNKICVALQMPLQSSIKHTIMSKGYRTVKQAQISAAFEACKTLYEQGELNERLLPVTKTECVAKVSEELFSHWKKFNDNVTSKTAGKQQRRLYNHRYPDELYNAVPQINELCYAYEIRAYPQFKADSYTEHIVTLLNTNCNYAILTRKPMPALAEMPLFMNQGKLSVKIAENPITLTITSEQQLKQLAKFHLMIFRDILECWKSFLVLDRRNQENAYFIAPLNNGKIDWELVQNFQRLLPQRKYSVSERQKKVYKPEDYIGKVVNKWYSGRDNQRFVVTKVLTDLTPQSAFDNNQYPSYIDFIDDKYKNEVDCVVQKDQFMLEVRALTSRRNFFVNAVGKSAKSHHNSSIIRLIPELCHNFMFPGDMWLKALLLPSILHRVHFMLHAEDLRRRVNKFLGIACNVAYQPKKLMIDESLARAIDMDGNAMEEPQEPKKVLPALPTQAKETVFTMTNLNDVLWKDYLEPEDLSRKQELMFPVELDYFYKFINGSILDTLTLSDEEWSESQLDMPKKPALETAENNMNIDRLKLCDAPLTEKRHLNILELTLSGENLKSAEQADFLAALTTAGANDVFDMERFEFLGDSFLKFSVSLYLVHKFPKWHEGFLTEVKGKFVSNRNLIYCMLDTDIPERISGYLFKPPHEWLPPLVSLPSNLLELFSTNENMLKSLTPSDLYAIQLNEDEIINGACSSERLSQIVSGSQRHFIDDGPAAEERRLDNELNLFIYKEALRDKVVADTLEAILGVCVKNYGIYNTFRMLEFFGICKPDPGKSFSHLMDLNFTSALLQASISPKEVDSFLINYQKLEENLGYKFRDRAFLLQALTHPSYPTNRITGCYQELEFIGDAILDFLISCYIFERYQHMTPGMLTDLRSALVNNVTLGGVCVRHRFHLFILAENSALAEKIKDFAKYQEKHNYIVSDDVQILMEETTVPTSETNGAAFNMASNVEVPKALGDILEALIAAVYLDSRDLRTTWHVIYGLLEQEINQFTQNIPLDAVRQLTEHKYANPKFADPICDEDVYLVKCQFTCLNRSVEVNGFGANGKLAKKAAAKQALQILAKRST
ncbi:endoribonuclease dcr-1 isoform X1 [Bactrocera neohumeralis]|uniref:endoribonuclease dcr-1 isoform X1 n=1 Tax=Bactrocera neohumeralis TaxID=98809 RepID=UPI0021666BA1|nr:endoribonuclease dcr-1 isoform X1 [Bactrocera neohumeralis]XP_050325822.1 endoribonuclease dcr-1 isoform X1 [Bactrocera neohumeralis]